MLAGMNLLPPGAYPADPWSLVKLVACRATRLCKGYEEVVVKVRSGLRFRVPLSSIHLVLVRSEPLGYTLLLEALTRCSTFVDVGAYAGGYSLRAALKVGRCGRVYAFEPDPYALKLLTYNVLANRLEGIVKIYPAAVADKCGEARLWIGVPGRSTLVRRMATGRASVRVATLKLDQVLAKGPCPAMVKVDAEGYGHAVLRGAEIVLEECRPVLYVELHEAGEAAVATELMLSHGYRVIVVDQGARAYAVGFHPSTSLARAVNEALKKVGSRLEAMARKLLSA
jgi:FkbM family methyltransferase